VLCRASDPGASSVKVPRRNGTGIKCIDPCPLDGSAVFRGGCPRRMESMEGRPITKMEGYKRPPAQY